MPLSPLLDPHSLSHYVFVGQLVSSSWAASDLITSCLVYLLRLTCRRRLTSQPKFRASRCTAAWKDYPLTYKYIPRSLEKGSIEELMTVL
jgi:hypothetical protein